MKWYSLELAIEELVDPPGRRLLKLEDDCELLRWPSPFETGRRVQVDAPLQALVLVLGIPANIELCSLSHLVVDDAGRQSASWLVGETVEWVPVELRSADERLWLVNIMTVRDCVAYEEARIARRVASVAAPGVGGPYFSGVYPYVLRGAELGGAHIIRWARGSGVFVSEAFADAMLADGISGAWFQELEVI